MMWYTHAVVGANTGWLVAVADPSVLQSHHTLPIVLGSAAFAALLPDLEADSAKIHYLGGGILRGFSGGWGNGYFRHRGFLHSVPMTVIILASSILFLDRVNHWLGVAIVFGYLSHIVIDGFNLGGVGYWYPFSLKRYFLIPKMLRSPVGGMGDKLLFILGAFGFAALLFVYWLNLQNVF